MTVDVAERLRAGAPHAFAGTPVRFALLFGSHARGEAGPRSDVDVAVSVGDDAGDRTSLVLDLQRRLSRHVGVECDVILLEDATLRLLHRVLHDGILVYDADPAARVDYVARMRVVAADYAVHAERMDREMLRAMAEGRR